MRSKDDWIFYFKKGNFAGISAVILYISGKFYEIILRISSNIYSLSE